MGLNKVKYTLHFEFIVMVELSEFKFKETPKEKSNFNYITCQFKQFYDLHLKNMYIKQMYILNKYLKCSFISFIIYINICI